MTIGKESSIGMRSKAEAFPGQKIMTGIRMTEIRTKKMNAWHTKRGGGNGKCEEDNSVNVFKQLLIIIEEVIPSEREQKLYQNNQKGLF